MGMLGVFPRGTIRKRGYKLKLFKTSFTDYARAAFLNQWSAMMGQVVCK
jgi:1-acyl-sn-glycerol-3-phosphate acyltransferase